MGKFEKGKIFRVEELIDYADGGIVSKELIHNPSGSVTLFSFDTGQGLSEHTAPYDALLYVFEGTIHVVKSGESFIIPSGARHAVNAAVRFKMVITMIRG